ncbi:unnamed protein product [Spirodela intermedia]|uniref:Pseudouridine synthase RsuA/RluA-like domain-containing protein n=1 Tax=Spirodela intermedia TaxID=51605 RepID=A0A7I8JK83_SPIIN|nr:unnamed protein product [Spirodela intermedia]CAA6670587.1 unnamed protein product [Spirodela intermedia]
MVHFASLPPLANVASLGKDLARGRRPMEPNLASTTALKWVRRCCPHLPVSLVQKLFRLRQIRRETVNTSSSTCLEHEAPQRLLKRVSGKEPLSSGDLILLPITVKEFLQEKNDYCLTQEELTTSRDESIIALNKPPGLPVQGGVGIKLSMDLLAGACLKYDYLEPPRLVHRLDRESSGVLVLGRTQTSASLLHSIFQEKTHGAFDEMGTDRRTLRKKYWALVIGNPKHLKGLVTAPLRKVVLENGKYEQITLATCDGHSPSRHAVTEYEVVESSHGFTWLELCPLTGRKHQLRVHCAEALGTPIVGDFKYGWSGHRKWQPLTSSPATRKREKVHNLSPLLALDSAAGSVLEQKPSLHLHCRQMILPDISLSLHQKLQTPAADRDISKLEGLELVAPLPSHMQRSWDALNYSARLNKP